jgi:hypothetical protein
VTRATLTTAASRRPATERATPAPARSPAAAVLALQRSAGNAATGRMLQRMAACPSHLGDADPVPPGWKPYFGDTSVFHCGFRTILEDRAPAAGDPMNECVYDHSGTLVDDSHPYAGCKGTPDQYDSKKDPIKHATIDSGGIVRAGAPAFADSVKHAVVEPVAEWLGGLDRDIRRLYGAP